ncbi:hypothetical protein SNEBB_004753 [Seison nebaliae]|nr:hypothetical protein SNEBB_004753 [Seison nebaliae]
MADRTTHSIYSLNDINNDNTEGVWSTDIEQSFQEALVLYPPCGRRKIILSDDNKMYGRNELIARYIQQQTGKYRSRKQVSSHIQVLAKRRHKELQSSTDLDALSKTKALEKLSAMSSSQIVSALHGQRLHSENPNNLSLSISSSNGNCIDINEALTPPYSFHDISPNQLNDNLKNNLTLPISQLTNIKMEPSSKTNTMKRCNDKEIITNGISSQYMVLESYSIYAILYDGVYDIPANSQENVEQIHEIIYFNNERYRNQAFETIDVNVIKDKFPEEIHKNLTNDKNQISNTYLMKFWGNLEFNSNLIKEYAVDTNLSTTYPMINCIECSTKICSFGEQVIEKIETQYVDANQENDRYFFRISHSVICDYIVSFLERLKRLNEKKRMNDVLENFSILQTVREKSSLKTFLSIAYIFEVSTTNMCTYPQIYRLIEIS